jgi:hypothetical protein
LQSRRGGRRERRRRPAEIWVTTLAGFSFYISCIPCSWAAAPRASWPRLSGCT